MSVARRRTQQIDGGCGVQIQIPQRRVPMGDQMDFLVGTAVDNQWVSNRIRI